jgi:hypothetical protein
VLLEASYLSADQFRSSDLVLSDYHLAPSFRTAGILLDPSGHLTRLHGIVCREYARRYWVRQRCLNATARVLEHVARGNVDACLFGAGVTTHILLTAGLKNATVLTRYAAVRALLAEHGVREFHEKLLERLGSVSMSRERAERHLSTLTDIFDAAKTCVSKAFPFASDISEIGRPLAIDGSREMIDRGYHREAMFWIAVTHSRCQKILAESEMPRTFKESYQDLLSDPGIASLDEIGKRCGEIRRFLPRVREVAEGIMEREIGHD